MIKKLFSFLLSVLIALLLIEGFFVLAYWIKDGRYWSSKDKMKLHFAGFINGEPSSPCINPRYLSPHPYLGFVRLTSPLCANGSNTNHYDPVPASKDPNKFTILVTGASVPVQLLEQAKPTLEEILSRHFRYHGKEIVVLNGASGSWKQPQQLIMLLLYINKIDAVVSIEGYNELTASFYYDYRYDMAAPMLQTYAKANTALLSPVQELMLLLFREIHLSTQKYTLLKKSKTIYFAIESLNAALLDKDGPRKKTPQYQNIENQFLLPESMTKEERRQRVFDEYENYLRQMHWISKANGVRLAVFIQPVPVIAKTLTPHEQAMVNDRTYRPDYEMMTSRLQKLNRTGIDIYSLTDIFSGETEAVYADKIHLDLQSHGPAIMNKAIVDTLAKHWGLDIVPPGTNP